MVMILETCLEIILRYDIRIDFLPDFSRYGMDVPCHITQSAISNNKKVDVAVRICRSFSV